MLHHNKVYVGRFYRNAIGQPCVVAYEEPGRDGLDLTIVHLKTGNISLVSEIDILFSEITQDEALL